MGNLLADGAAWLSEQRHAHVASGVVYERDGERLEISATVGLTTWEVEESGTLQKVESRDFIVRAADLAFGLPRRGDRIRETVGGTVLIYEVLAPAGEDVWRYSDPQRNDVRVHTKHVDTEELA